MTFLGNFYNNDVEIIFQMLLFQNVLVWMSVYPVKEHHFIL
jgi:hypothetical protein